MNICFVKKNIPKNQTQSVSTEVKAVFIDCLSTTTSHGLPQIFKSGNLVLNFTWTLFFLVALAGGCFMIHEIFDQYLQYNVLTMTKIERAVKMPLPAITFCSPEYMFVQDFFLSCSINNNSSACKMNNLTLYDYDSSKYNCVQLNYGKIESELVQAIKEGVNYGYSILFYIPVNVSYLISAITDNRAQVILDDVSEKIYPGYETGIVLSKTSQTLLGPPYSDCYDLIDYRQVNCVMKCIFKKISEICGCDFPTKCENINNLSNCSIAVKQKFKINCNSECRPECSQIFFPRSRIDVLIENKNTLLQRYYTTENLKRMVKLHIYFDNLETTEITQSPSMTLSNFIANVGGLMGIF